MLDRLAEADAGIEQDLLLTDPLPERELEPLLQERLHVVDDVAVSGRDLHRGRRPEHVHQAAPDPVIGHQAGHRWIGAKRGDVVDQRRSGRDRGLGHLDLGGVDRQRDTEARGAQAAKHGHDALAFDGAGHLLGAGAGGLPAHVDDVGALAGELAPVRHRGVRGQEESPVGERVGGDVEHAHDLELGGHSAIMAYRQCERVSPPSV